MSALLVAVEFDLYDGSASQTLRLSTDTLTAVIDDGPVQYVPLLVTPIQLGTRISGEQYGSPERAAANAGTIEFALAGELDGSQINLWPWLDYHWKGRTFRVYAGEQGDRYEDLTLVYTGRVDDLAHNTLRASVKTTDASADLDKPLVDELYGVVIGNAVSGATATNAPGANRLFLRQSTADIDSTLAYVSVTPRSTSATAKFAAVVYSDTGGAPGVLLRGGAEVVGCDDGVALTGALATPLTLVKDEVYWLGFITDTSSRLAEEDATLDDGVKASVTYAAGPPMAAPTMTTGQPAWLIWGSNINAGDATAPAPANIIGLPRPRLFGQRFSIQPLLEDQQNLVYRVHDGALAAVDALSVGGILWDYAAGTPVQGQWSADLTKGTVTLGAVTLGGEVRVDAKAVGWDTLTTAALYRRVAAIGGLSVDETAMAALDVAVPDLVGLYAAQAVNMLDLLDRIAVGTGTMWGVGFDEKLTAHAIAAPGDVADLALAAGGEANGDIASLQQSSLIPPTWRLRIGYAGNENPETQFEPAVTEFDQARLGAGGLIAPAFRDRTIKVAEPKAVDLALIASLFNTEAAAIAMRDRLSAAWGVQRRLYDLTVWTSAEAINLYDTASIDYMMVQGNFRIHSAVVSFGGGPAQLQVWG